MKIENLNKKELDEYDPTKDTDVIKEEMDDSEKNTGLGLVVENKDEEVFEIVCDKKLVSGEDKEGIDLDIFHFISI